MILDIISRSRSIYLIFRHVRVPKVFQSKSIYKSFQLAKIVWKNHKYREFQKKANSDLQTQKSTGTFVNLKNAKLSNSTKIH